jgi:hypothetical protein
VTVPCIYALYPKLAHPFHYSSFYLTPLLMVKSIGLKVIYLLLYREYIIHIHLLYFLLLLSPSFLCPLLSMICFSFLSLIVLVSVHCSVEFLPVHALCLNQCNPLPLFFLSHVYNSFRLFFSVHGDLIQLMSIKEDSTFSVPLSRCLDCLEFV